VAVDLVGATLTRRQSLLVDDDALVVLESIGSRDRVRRVLYDRVASVVVWRALPWVRMLLVAVLAGLPGMGMLTLEGGEYVGWPLLIFTIIALGRYLYSGKTFIRMRRGRADMTLTTIARPGKVEKALERLCRHIERAQGDAIRRAAERQPEQ
jgi:hypothetical protein